MIKYIKTKAADAGCGCRACEQICPKQALTMVADEEGFLYPSLDETRCVECGLCDRVCPVEHRPEGYSNIEVYALQHKDEAILADSSSGGAFRLLADAVIARGGCVVGCVWNEEGHPVLRVAETAEELIPMQGSKYLFSDTESVYRQVKERLAAGQTVLFTGAPCQCAALLNFLGRPYENLYTADFLCHGMPSWQAFDSYVDSLRKQYGSSVSDFKFRDKSKRGWGLAFSFKHKRKKHVNVGQTDEYQYAFTKGYLNRYTCYSCPFRGEKRFTDFTFCDYWGIEQFHPQIEREKGVSALSVNSEKAAAMKATLGDATFERTEAESVAKENASLLHPHKEEIPVLRRTVYAQIKERGWRATARKHFRVKHRALRRIYYAAPRRLVKMAKKCLGR